MSTQGPPPKIEKLDIKVIINDIKNNAELNTKEKN